MALHRLRLFELALVAGVVTTTVQAAERDVVWWEGARWGMNEREIRDAFSSKLLVPLARKQPDETVLSIPGYVYRGVLSTSPSVSRVPAGWSGSTSPKWEIYRVTAAMASPVMGPPASCSIAGSRTCSGRGRPEAPRNPGPSLRRMSRPVVRMQEALTSPSRGTLRRSREARHQGFERHSRHLGPSTRLSSDLQWERRLPDQDDNAVNRRAQLTLAAGGSSSSPL